MATNFSTWLVDVLPECPGLLADMATHHIRDACIDFCERTWAWRANITGNLVAGTATYALSPPASSQITGVLRALAAPEVGATQQRLRKVGEDAVNAAYPASGPVQAFTMADRDTALFYPTPDDTYGYTVRVALRPTAGATQLVEDSIYAEYRYTIAQGALARLKRMAGKPWSDSAGAVACQSEFVRGVREAKLSANRDFIGDDIAVDLTLGRF